MYISNVGVVRKTADDCRRLLGILDALQVEYETIAVDNEEMRKIFASIATSKAIPQCFVGETLIGTYDQIFELNEDGQLQHTLRAAGYSGKLRGGEDIPVAQVVKKKVVKKVVVVKKKAPGAAGDDDAPPPPPEDEEEPPPPPPEDEEPPPPPPDDEEPPPPPPDDEPAPPPPPDEEEPVPPPPPDEEGDAPPPPPE